jgi:hypothetical protein
MSYLSDNFHYSLASSQQSACSVEPGTAEDVSEIVSSRELNTPATTKPGFLVAGHLSKFPNILCGERGRSCDKSGFFLNAGCSDFDDAIQ